MISILKKKFTFSGQLRCQNHPQNQHQIDEKIKKPLMTYCMGQCQIPTIKCEIIDEKYIQRQQNCKIFIKRLQQHGNDYLKYIEHLQEAKNQRGNNKQNKFKQARRFRAYLDWEQSKDRCQLVQRPYFCHNSTMYLPMKLSELLSRKPKLVYPKSLNATINKQAFPNYLLLKEQNNFRKTIQQIFGQGSFSKQYFFSKEISNATITVTDMYGFSAKRNAQFKRLMQIHDKIPLQIRKSRIPMAGNGVFALKRIPANTQLMFYVGQHRNAFQNWPPSDSVYDLGYLKLEAKETDIFPLVIEPLKKMNAARFINTAIDGPFTGIYNNLQIQKVIVNGVIGLLLSTGNQAIEEGSQLFYSYGNNYGFGKQFVKIENQRGGYLSDIGIKPQWKKLLRKQQKRNEKKQQQQQQQQYEKQQKVAVINQIRDLNDDVSDQHPMQIQQPIQVQDQIFYSDQSVKQSDRQNHHAASQDPIEKAQHQIEKPCIDVCGIQLQNPVIDVQLPQQQPCAITQTIQVVPEKHDQEIELTKQKQINLKYLNSFKDRIKGIGPVEMEPMKKIQLLYASYSRIAYNKYSLAHPRMRQAQKITQIVRKWQAMTIQQKVELYKQYFNNDLLNYNDQSSSESQNSDSSQNLRKKRPTRNIRETASEKPKNAVRVFIAQSQQQPIQQQQQEEENQQPIKLQIKQPTKYQRHISLHQLRAFVKRQLLKVGIQIPQLSKMGYLSIFDCLYGNPFIQSTQRQRIRQYRICRLCNRKQNSERLGNHLNQKHNNIRNMLSMYVNSSQKTPSWFLIECQDANPLMFEYWKFLQSFKRHSAYKMKQAQMLSGSMSEQLSIEKRLIMFKIFTQKRHKQQKIVVQVQKCGRKNIPGCQTVFKSSVQGNEITKTVDYLFSIQNTDVVDRNGRALSKQSLIANMHFKGNQPIYLKKNGKMIRLIDFNTFKNRRGRKDKINKTKLIKKVQSKLKKCQSKTAQRKMQEKADEELFTCPICSRQFQTSKKYHILSCLEYTKICLKCDQPYTALFKHDCKNIPNNMIQVNEMSMDVNQHIHYVLEHHIGTQMDMQQNQCLIKVPQADVMQTEKNEELMNNEIYQSDESLQLNKLEPNNQVNQESRNEIRGLLRKKLQPVKSITQTHAERQSKRRSKLVENMKRALQNIDSTIHNNNRIIDQKGFNIAKLVIQARIERQQWVQSHNTCSICLSQLSPHVAHLKPILIKQLLLNPNGIIASEIQRIGTQGQKSICQLDIAKIITYANYIAFRQCQKCTKIYHLACWQNQRKMKGSSDTRCANCRETESIYPPKSILLDGSQSEYSKLLDVAYFKALLNKFSIKM